MTRSVFFLDIATKSGWCEGEPGSKPIFGSLVLGGEGAEHPAKNGALFKFLGGRFQAFRPRAFVYEAPLARNASTAELLMGLAGTAQAAAYLCGVPIIRQSHVSSVRAFFLPKGSPRGGPAVKQAVIAECRRRGYEPQNDDEADAIAGWEHACSLLYPNVTRAQQSQEALF